MFKVSIHNSQSTTSYTILLYTRQIEPKSIKKNCKDDFFEIIFEVCCRRLFF
jgi:hypothetical protein